MVSVWPPRGQCALQFFATSKHVRLDGTERNVEDARGFVMRQSVLAAKHNCGALVQRKLTQGMHKIVSQTSVDSLWIMLRLQLRLIHADKLFAFACILAKTVVSDSVKPCGKPRITAKAPDVFVRAKKSFLGEIVGQGNICPGELAQQTTHAGLMAAHELAECVLIVVDKSSRDEVRIS